MNQVDTSKGMSPRKALASSKSPGDFGVMATPRNPARTDVTGELPDTTRGIGGAITHTSGMMPAQAAPDHGPMPPDKWKRGAPA